MKQKQVVDDVWKTQDGRLIAVKDMTDSHLLNTISFLQRNAECRRANNSIFYTTCVPPNGDMAQMCFEHEFDFAITATWEDFVPGIYFVMVDDATKRGLQIKDEISLAAAELSAILGERKKYTGERSFES